MHPSLHSPFHLGIWTLSHRVVMAPLNRLGSLQPEGIPSPASIRYYGARASCGGLIVAESAAVSARGMAQPGTAGMFTSKQVNSWREVTDVVHLRGGIIFAQLWHAGRLVRTEINGMPPVSASNVAARGPIHAPGLHSGPGETPVALDDDGIDKVIDEYRRAAENAADAGFDGVEMCCANGCLADQFLHDGSNLRNDRYGGSIENRTRFLIDTVQALSSVWGATRVGVRLSPLGLINDVSDSDPGALFAYLLPRLQDEGVAYVHLMEPDAGAGWQDAGSGAPAAPHVRWRDLFGGTLLLSGGFDADGGSTAKAAIEDGHADAIAFGRAFVANPDLPFRLAEGLPLEPFDPSLVFTLDDKS
jgi:N-ethylmaleimide reductase